MNWSSFADEAPELARLGQERFDAVGLVLVGSIRRDGSPRISPVEPLITDGELYLGMMWQSKKALDLLRDPRCVVHSVVSKPDASEGELKLWGRARDVADPRERERCADAYFTKINWRPSEPYHLFAVDIESVSWIKSSGEEQLVIRWRPGRAAETSLRKWTGSGYAD
jgi:hypothetical protein